MPVIRDFLKGVRRVLKRISFGNELFLLSFRRAWIFSLSLSFFGFIKRFILSTRESKSLIFFFFFFTVEHTRKLDENICCRMFDYEC